MEQSNKGLILNPEVLKWARETAGESLDSTANRLNTTKNVVEEWEQKGMPLSFARLHALADFYKRSVAALMLPAIPLEPSFPTDFRRARGQSKTSKKTRLAIRRACRLQNLAANLAQELGGDITLKLFRISNINNPAASAQKLREVLGITIEDQSGWENERAALKQWISALEKAGVSVFQMSIPKAEARGIALSGNGDKKSAIVLTTQDSVRGRIFTLFHEVGHLLLGESGICNLKNLNSRVRSENEYEIFCDEFAGNFLLPVGTLNSDGLFTTFLDGLGLSILRRISLKYKVSQEMVLVRLYRTQKLSYTVFRELLKLAQEKRKPTSDGFQLPHQKCIGEVGRPLISQTFDAMKKGKLNVADAVSYLGLSRKHFKRLHGLI